MVAIFSTSCGTIPGPEKEPCGLLMSELLTFPSKHSAADRSRSIGTTAPLSSAFRAGDEGEGEGKALFGKSRNIFSGVAGVEKREGEGLKRVGQSLRVDSKR